MAVTSHVGVAVAQVSGGEAAAAGAPAGRDAVSPDGPAAPRPGMPPDENPREPEAMPGRPAWVGRAQTLPRSDAGSGLGSGDRGFEDESRRR